MRRNSNIRYRALDGCAFRYKKDLVKYQALCLKIMKIMDKFNPIPEGEEKSFFEGKTSVQQDKKVVEYATQQYLKIFNAKFNYDAKEIETCSQSMKLHKSIYRDNDTHQCIRELYNKLYNIDSNYMEWRDTGFGSHYTHKNMMEVRAAKVLRKQRKAINDTKKVKDVTKNSTNGRKIQGSKEES